MKKLLSIMLAGIFGIALSVGSASAASDCLNVKFNNGDSVCLGIEKSGSKDFNLSIDKNNLSSNSTIRCYVVLPNANMYTINGCKGSFSYAGAGTKEIIVSATYVTRNNDFFSKRIPVDINFNNGSWGSNNNVISSSSSSSSSNSDEVQLSTNRKSPSTSQYVNLTIKTDKNYTGRLTLSAKYRSSSSSSWSSVSNTSSTYFSSYSDEWDDGYYKMRSSDKGNVTLSNLLKFKKNGYYRIYVKDTDGNESYIQFNVGVSSDSSNSDLTVKASPSSPDTYEWVKLTISTDRDYTGKIKFSKLQYKSSSSSSWSSISNITSSTYVSDYSSDWSNGYYKMTSSDRGEATLKNLVKFKKSGYYRIYVEDTDGNESYVQINVDTSSSSSSSSDDIELSTNRKSPSTNQYVNLTIETDRDYVGKLTLSAKYRSSSSSSWSSISNTSSTYFSSYSDEWENGFYRMVSSDKGKYTIDNLLKFKKSGYYRIYVKDYDDNESYIEFNVDTSSSSSSSNDDLTVKASPSSPDTYEWVKLTIETDDDYTGKINFSKFQYKSSSSSSWSTISNRTSNTYVSDYSSEWSNGYYRMTSSDDGYVTLKNLVKFKKSGYYRIYVEDTDGNESYVQIDVDTSSSSSSSSDDIELSTNRKSPSTSQYVNLTIETDSKYTGKLTLSAKYRSSSSSSWSSVSNTSSTYFSSYSDEWDDGYYKMRSSDKGNVTLSNLLKFKKNGYYRIYVKDTDGNESYIQFNVGDVDDDDDTSKVDGFTSKEYSKVKSVYKDWDSMIGEMQRKYPSLKKDTYWVRLSNNFYDDMKDVVNNVRYRNFSDYDDFEKAFNDWYKYTLNNI